MGTRWERLADRLVRRWRADELILLEGAEEAFREDLADFLAGRAGLGTDGAVIADWLLDREDVEDVLCDDDTLTATLAEEARRVVEGGAAEPSEGSAEAEAARDEAREGRIDERLPELLSSFGRRPHFPEVEPEDGKPGDSKFGGTPLFAPGEPWPSCENCDEPMHLMVQVDLAALPERAWVHRRGWVQLFYCMSEDPPCEADCQAWSPGAGSTLVRWLERGEEREIDDDERPPPPAPDFLPSRIVTWVEGREELPALGDSAELEARLAEEEIDHADLFERGVTPSANDKVGGWPAWVQAPAYPRCPECHRAMGHLMQLESDSWAAHAFGGEGRGHLFQCADHVEYLAFSWTSR